MKPDDQGLVAADDLAGVEHGGLQPLIGEVPVRASPPDDADMRSTGFRVNNYFAVEPRESTCYVLLMKLEQKAAALRAMRAILVIDQASVAERSGISERMILEAEKGRSCSMRTWDTLTGWYSEQGLMTIDRGRTVSITFGV